MSEIFEISFTYELVGKTKIKADNASEAFWKLTDELKENGLDKIEYKTVDTNFSVLVPLPSIEELMRVKDEKDSSY